MTSALAILAALILAVTAARAEEGPMPDFVRTGK
jgi:hypothetical protein